MMNKFSRSNYSQGRHSGTHRSSSPPPAPTMKYNKCSNPKCSFQNELQAVKGVYNCDGSTVTKTGPTTRNPFPVVAIDPCEGTYVVSSTQARYVNWREGVKSSIKRPFELSDKAAEKRMRIRLRAIREYEEQIELDGKASRKRNKMNKFHSVFKLQWQWQLPKFRIRGFPAIRPKTKERHSLSGAATERVQVRFSVPERRERGRGGGTCGTGIWDERRHGVFVEGEIMPSASRTETRRPRLVAFKVPGKIVIV
ncbi:hypothetical protein AMATHDRAFT_64721 [Amanita thiersii Skay4041]|uniref:Uncharacterized protein n=1 Tax=Amanita thiersii Skay4041 TaxID=703135 RepID=A0A2A9NM74_9AGAR|nr:hypothetical protein AMATHDRAFT_64721 [Amanita thiersii Skay4041]